MSAAPPTNDDDVLRHQEAQPVHVGAANERRKQLSDLYQANRDLLIRRAAYWLDQRYGEDVIEDVIQTAFLRLIRFYVNKGTPQEEWLTLLRTITKHLCLTLLKTGRLPEAPINPKLEDAIEGGSPTGDQSHFDYLLADFMVSSWRISSAAHDQLAAVIRCFESLTPRQREALELISRDGLTYEQTAMRMGISDNTVKALVSQARKRLVKVINDSVDGPRCEPSKPP